MKAGCPLARSLGRGPTDGYGFVNIDFGLYGDGLSVEDLCHSVSDATIGFIGLQFLRELWRVVGRLAGA